MALFGASSGVLSAAEILSAKGCLKGNDIAAQGKRSAALGFRASKERKALKGRSNTGAMSGTSTAN